MKKLTWKLMPLAALFALGVLAITTGGHPPSASAIVTADLSSSPSVSFGSGGNATINVPAQDDDGDIVLTASGGTNPRLTVASCAGAGVCPGGNITGNNSAAVTITTATIDGDATVDTLTVSLTLTATCLADATVTLTATQNATSEAVDVTCEATPNIRIVKETTTATTTAFDFSIAGTSTECDDTSFILGQDDDADFNCDVPGSYVVTEKVTAGWVLDDISCVSANDSVPADDIDISVSTRTVTITLAGQDDSVECTFTNTAAATATPTATATRTATAIPPTATAIPPTATATPVGVASVSVEVFPDGITCFDGAFINVIVRDGTGAFAADGTVVSLEASNGLVIPPQAATAGGGLLAIYSSPDEADHDVTITATAKGVSGEASVDVSCGSEEQAATADEEPPPPATLITPPATGDAGLVDSRGWQWYMGIILIAGSLGGTMMVVRTCK